jgi:DNA-binding response OmpR family regulator
MMPEKQILIVEDEPSVAEVVGLYLKRAGYPTVTFGDGRAALDWLQQNSPLLVVLDLMLPGATGFEITRWLRLRSDTPIIMLTARGEETDRIAGLEMGADDYIVKPFSPQELVSRVRAVLRRAQPAGEGVTEKPLRYGNLMIDPQSHLVVVDNQEKPLTAREFDLLWLLASHPRQVFTRDQLLDRVWGSAEFIDPATVTVHIRRLREKIEADPNHPLHLLTMWGVGYKYEP